jgi:hypothetical protein
VNSTLVKPVVVEEKIAAVNAMLECEHQLTLVDAKLDGQTWLRICVNDWVANVGVNPLPPKLNSMSADAKSSQWGCDVSEGDGHGF